MWQPEHGTGVPGQAGHTVTTAWRVSRRTGRTVAQLTHTSLRGRVPQPPQGHCHAFRRVLTATCHTVNVASGALGAGPRADITDGDVPWSGLVEGEEDARERER